MSAIRELTALKAALKSLASRIAPSYPDISIGEQDTESVDKTAKGYCVSLSSPISKERSKLRIGRRYDAIESELLEAVREQPFVDKVCERRVQYVYSAYPDELLVRHLSYLIYPSREETIKAILEEAVSETASKLKVKPSGYEVTLKDSRLSVALSFRTDTLFDYTYAYDIARAGFEAIRREADEVITAEIGDGVPSVISEGTSEDNRKKYAIITVTYDAKGRI